jgi:hypothetical protein
VVTCASDRAAAGGTAEVKATGRGTGPVGRSIRILKHPDSEQVRSVEHSEHVVEHPVQQDQHAAQQEHASMQRAALLETLLSIA